MKLIAILALALVSTVVSQDIGTLVLNGDVAQRNQFPYAVGLITHLPNGNGFCTGSLVSSNFILTSARCIDGIDSALAVLGSVRALDQSESGQVRIFCDKIIVHPEYRANPNVYDVGLLKLVKPATLSNSIVPIRFPKRKQSNFYKKKTITVGWGKFGKGGANSEELRYGNATVITNLYCSLSLPTNTVDGTHVCTEGDTSPCTGDDGSPLAITESDGKPTLIGVYKFVSVLGCEKSPSAVYVRTSEYLKWIEENSDVKIRP